MNTQMNTQSQSAPRIVYHMTPAAEWRAQQDNAEFVEPTLADEGFIHCTAERDLLPVVANRHYRATPGEWVLLAVDTMQLAAPLRWEPADGHLFPHVYGPINRAAIVDVLPFPRRADGKFLGIEQDQR